MTGADTALAAFLLPLAGAALIVLAGRKPNLRDAITLVTSVTLLVLVCLLVPRIQAGESIQVTFARILPGLSLAFTIEPLGLLFALVASALWIATSAYAIGYMRAHHEENQTRFFVCFAVAISATMGVAFAGNLLTLFVFYEALTLSTYPLVTHAGTEEAKKAGRVYLGILLSTSIAFLFMGMIWTWSVAGTLDFRRGGLPGDGRTALPLLPVLLGLYAFGIGKAALMPFHRWLPAAMVAPTPVSALLHAVAVVKAGVFSILKVVVYIFGTDFLRTTNASEWLAWVASATILLASIVAFTKDNLKARLAYSTVSQLSYIVLGAALATKWGIIGGGMHIAMHAFGKITLFFCAGAIMVAAHKTEISTMDGLGRRMPLTLAAFFVGALSVIGLPPLGGSWSKWFLVMGTAETGQLVLMGVLLLSTLLNIGYLLPIPLRAFFSPPPPDPHGHEEPGIHEAPAFCVVPLCLTAAGCIALFFFAGPVYPLIQSTTTQAMDHELKTIDPATDRRWLDDDRNVKKIVWALVAVCAGLAAADLFYVKHAHFSWEMWFGFYGFYGFVCCVLLVLSAKQMRRVLKRDEEYYDR